MWIPECVCSLLNVSWMLDLASKVAFGMCLRMSLGDHTLNVDSMWIPECVCSLLNVSGMLDLASKIVFRMCL